MASARHLPPSILLAWGSAILPFCWEQDLRSSPLLHQKSQIGSFSRFMPIPNCDGPKKLISFCIRVGLWTWSSRSLLYTLQKAANQTPVLALLPQTYSWISQSQGYCPTYDISKGLFSFINYVRLIWLTGVSLTAFHRKQLKGILS